MHLVQLTDLHVRPRGVAAYRVVESNTMTERALRSVMALDVRPDAIVLTGDLTDCGLHGEYAELAAILGRALPKGAPPVYAIPGNHDRREAMIAHLPGTRHEGGFVQYVVDELQVRLVMLDTVAPGYGHGELCAARLAWLEAALAAAPERPTIVAMHHPPFACGIAHMDAINLRQSAEFAAIIGRHRQVERIICGHHHRPITARVGHAIAQIASSVAHQVELSLGPDGASAFVMEPPGFMVHRYAPETGVVSHQALVERYPGPFPFLTEPEYPGKLP